MAKKSYFIFLLLFGCNNSYTDDNNLKYHQGKLLYEKKCSPCHSFLTMEGLSQTSLDQMRQLPFDSLYIKILKIKIDSNHVKPPLNINNLGKVEIRKIVFYIKETGEPKY